MALKVGSLYVRLTADAAPLIRGLSGAIKAVESFAKQAKQVSGAIGGVANAMVAMGGASIALAASVDGRTKASVQQLEGATKSLAIQIADILAPALREATALFHRAAGVVAGLSPEVRASIANWAVFAVELAAASKVVQVLSSVIGPLGGAIRATLGVVASVGVPTMVAFAAGVGVLVGVVVLLHKVWRENWAGIQQATADALAWIQDAFSGFTSFMKSVWDWQIDRVASFVNALLAAGETLERVIGKDLGVAGMKEGFAGLFKDLKSGAFVSEGVKFGKAVGSAVVDGFKAEVGQISRELGLGKLFAQLSGAGGAVRAASGGGPTRLVSGIAGAGLGVVSTRMPDAKEGSRISSGPQAAISSAAQITEAAERAAAEFERAMAAMRATMAQSLLAATGELGAVISRVASAGAQGGPWSALLQVFLELFQQTEAWGRMLGTFGYALKRIGEMVGPLVEAIGPPIEKLVAVVVELLAPLFKALGDVFGVIGQVIEDIVPILEPIGAIFAAVGAIISAIGSILKAVFVILKPLFEAVFGIIKAVASIVLGIIGGLIDVWNWIVEAIAGLADLVGGGDEIRKAKADKTDINEAMAALNDSTYESAKANAANTKATWDAAQANKEAAGAAVSVAESFQNVPSGYKLALARFGSTAGMNADGSPISQQGDTTNERKTDNSITIGTVNITTRPDTDGGDTWREMIAEAKRERSRRFGNPYAREGGL